MRPVFWLFSLLWLAQKSSQFIRGGTDDQGHASTDLQQEIIPIAIK